MAKKILPIKESDSTATAQAKLTSILFAHRKVTIEKSAYWKCFPSGEWDLRLYCAAHKFTYGMENRKLVIRFPQTPPPRGVGNLARGKT